VDVCLRREGARGPGGLNVLEINPFMLPSSNRLRELIASSTSGCVMRL